MSVIVIKSHNELSEKQKTSIKDAKVLLEKAGLEIEEFDTPLDSFFSEEAEYRIRFYCDSNDIIDGKEISRLIAEYKETLAEMFWNSDNLICGDELDDLTKECLEG